MSFFRKLFSKSPSDLLTKGDKYMDTDCYFDARTCYEDGLQLCSGGDSDAELQAVFSKRIDEANLKLAELNLREAEFSHSHGDIAKAIDHLELVKTLTKDSDLCKKADTLLLMYSQPDDSPVAQKAPAASCSSCAGSSRDESAQEVHIDHSLAQHEYYELLIQQLPPEEHERYAELGDDFAEAYIAASHDSHAEALSGFEKCRDALPQDIYFYEKGKLLHRLGKDREAEQHLRKAVQLNRANSLAWLNLALVLGASHSFQNALETIEIMVTENILAGQAMLLRAEIFEATGNHEAAVNQYVELLQTPNARTAAEKLYIILQEIGRHDDAAIIFKKYLNKSCH